MALIAKLVLTEMRRLQAMPEHLSLLEYQSERSRRGDTLATWTSERFWIFPDRCPMLKWYK